MPTPLDAAKLTVDDLMNYAAALVHHGPPDLTGWQAAVELVLAKARTARAALETLTAGTEPFEQRDAERAQSNRLRDPPVPIEPSQPESGAKLRHERLGDVKQDVKPEHETLFPNTKPAGSAVSYGTVNPPKQERGGPKDADKAPGVFKSEFGEGSGQIHPVANFHHCELCGIRLDVERLDPCRINECPHPRPQDQA